jgi:ribosomal-protein-alanine N-acetyltransferase
MKIFTNNLRLETLDSSYIDDILKYYIKNDDFHKFSMPKKNIDFYTTDFMASMIEQEEILMKNNLFYRFYIFKNEEKSIIGDISIYDIKYSNIQSCYIGIKIDVDNVNIGVGSAALKRVLEFIKTNLELHSARATILPDNKNSMKLFEKFGFQFDGAIKELFLSENGWLDHLHFTKILD